MKKSMTWATGLVAAAYLLAPGVEAAPRSHYFRDAPRFYAGERRDVYAAPKRPVETMDTIQANDLDPAGNYKGYPDWARKAFAPKN